MRFVRVVALVLALLALPGAAAARNVALVIGNSAYGNTNVLTNPVNDANLVAGAAARAGFEVVQAQDLGNAAFQRTLRDFRQKAEGADVAMIYYAGHGIEGQGKNWLIPTDAKLESEFDLPYEAIDLDRLLESMIGARMRMVVLDACRNNPFGTNWKRGVRAVANGLGQVDVDDVMVIFAAAPGQVATDGQGGNSPFARSLAQRLPQPGLAVQMLGGMVRDDVLAATGGQQRPFVSASVTGTPIYLVSAPLLQAQPAAQPQQPVASSDRSTTEALMWQGVVAANSPGGYQAFLREFPSGIFANLAREKLAQMQGAAPAVQVASRDATVQGASQPAPQVAAVRETPVAIAAPSPAPALPVAPAPEPVAVAAARPAIAMGAGGLPVMPAAPQFAEAGYPGCKDDFRSLSVNIKKVEAINRCMSALDDYQRGTLQPFRFAMNKHQIEIGQIYTEQVGGTGRYQPELQNQWYEAMVRENAASLPDGANYSAYRPVEARYNADREYLQDRYCYYTGCNGYPALSMLGNDAEPAKPAK
ncbi:MAG: caspase family protein [Sphingomonadales bacterium]|nr:caspase family protein [Sphingomonadales bacterium]